VSPHDEAEVELLLRWLARWERPPVGVHNALVALFDQTHDTLASALSFECIAELLFDSRRDLVTPSTRGPGSTGLGYRLAFTSVHADVVLHVDEKGNDLTTIHGQVMARIPRQDRFLVATVDESSAGSMPLPADSYGRFVLADVPSTVRSIRLATDEFQVLVRLPRETNDL
jgi:hypothetical protein